MTTLAEKYPNCQNAIRWMMICENTDPSNSFFAAFREVIQRKRITVDQLIVLLVDAAQANQKCTHKELIEKAEKEFATDDFRKWSLATFYGAM